jgi:hypothetical protein
MALELKSRVKASGDGSSQLLGTAADLTLVMLILQEASRGN